MNKLGERGLYTIASKRKMRQDQIDQAQDIEKLQAQVATLTTERDAALAKGTSTKKISVKLEAAKEDLKEIGRAHV